MAQTRVVWVSAVVLTCLLLASAAWAQVATGGIAGLVRDSSGGVLPGVTVEAASPALIEKVRTVVSDNAGRYSIASLQPGTYTVTFTLPGFNTVKREGIVLTAGFTATVNADMPVGALEETVTVSGEAPLVDTQNTRQQTQLSGETLKALPRSQGAMNMIVAFTPGATGNVEVGASQAASWSENAGGNVIRYHGKAGIDQKFDGLDISSANGSTGFMVNPLLIQELVVEKGMGSSEATTSQLGFNAIPKDGGNTFNFLASGLYTNHHFQGNNVDDALRARGVTNPEGVNWVYTSGGSVGGPIVKNKLWFHSAAERLAATNFSAGNFYNKLQSSTGTSPLYEPDTTRPYSPWDETSRVGGRGTWQASPRNKVSASAEYQKITEHYQRGFNDPAAAEFYTFHADLYQGTWNSPVSNKLLLEAAVSHTGWGYTNFPTPEVPDPATTVGVTELTITGVDVNRPYRYSSRDYNYTNFPRNAQRFSMSYVTGSHAFKVGVSAAEASSLSCSRCAGPQLHYSYDMNNQVPSSIAQFATPYNTRSKIKLEFGVYAQDQWAIKRLTVNYGLRFDYFNGQVDAQETADTRPSGGFIAARSFDAVKNVPRWTDVNPRLGLSYDLFGNGRTALKYGVGRYLVKESASVAGANNPITTAVNQVKRNWTDANKDFVPQCNLNILTANGECGQVNNLNFGGTRASTTYSKDVLEGFGVRPANWDMSAEVQHQLARGLSFTAGFYRTQYDHVGSGGTAQFVTDNQLVTPADYDTYCVTAPVDSRLPSGGGYQVCGLYDIKPALFGKTQNIVKQPSEFGDPSVVSRFYSLSISSRFASGLLLSGGLDTGTIITDDCFVVDSPQQLLNCRVETPYGTRTQLKMQGSYPLPREFSVSGTLQNTAGSLYTADWSVTNDQIKGSLGRNLAACGTKTVCSSSVNVPLLPPDTYTQPRRTQLDLRLSKVVRLGSKSRLRANFDIYNALNSNAVINLISGYGPKWLYPADGGSTGIGLLGARLLQFSGELTF